MVKGPVEIVVFFYGSEANHGEVAFKGLALVLLGDIEGPASDVKARVGAELLGRLVDVGSGDVGWGNAIVVEDIEHLHESVWRRPITIVERLVHE